MNADTVKNRLSRNLREMMGRQDLRPCDLVRKCGHEVTDQTISNILSEKHEPRASVLCTICEALGITPDMMLGIRQIPKKRKTAARSNKLVKAT